MPAKLYAPAPAELISKHHLMAMRQAELQLAAEGVGFYTGAPRKTQLYTDATKSSAQPGHSPPGWAAPIGRIQ